MFKWGAFAGKKKEGESGVADGARTHDHWNHNPGLYQLSYSHRSIADKLFNTFTSYLVMTPILQTNGTPGRTRTCDHPLRRRMLYPAELRAHTGSRTLAGSRYS